MNHGTSTPYQGKRKSWCTTLVRCTCTTTTLLDVHVLDFDVYCYVYFDLDCYAYLDFLRRLPRLPRRLLRLPRSFRLPKLRRPSAATAAAQLEAQWNQSSCALECRPWHGNAVSTPCIFVRWCRRRLLINMRSPESSHCSKLSKDHDESQPLARTIDIIRRLLFFLITKDLRGPNDEGG